jgi:NADPH:quinone reductase-like Zn-dependent oxidoreductase
VPLSDCCGEVAAVGSGVSESLLGERVVGAFFPGWTDGPFRSEYLRSQLGIAGTGVLAEYVTLRAGSVVAAPAHLTDHEASTLSTSGLTAFNCLFGDHPIQARSTVLILGTGGVSMFALQMAVAAGARAICTSSSDARLARVTQIGASATTNYQTSSRWVDDVIAASGGNGVDLVVDVVGDLESSLRAVAANGTVGLIGQSLGSGGPVRALNVREMVRKVVTLRSLMVGSVALLRQMCDFVTEHQIRPVIDTVHRFEDTHTAYEQLAAGSPFGKVIITVG